MKPYLPTGLSTCCTPVSSLWYPRTSGTFPARCARCTQRRARSSSENLPCTCSRTCNTARPLTSFLHSSDSFLLISQQQNIDPTRPFFFFFISLVPTFHCLPWQTLLVLSTFNLRRAGGATKSKGHIQYLR